MLPSLLRERGQSRFPRVKLVAVAKDEAAYLAEWIHHHLYFGFNEIDIYLNRTRDTSQTVLDQICYHYDQVNVHTADWIDSCQEAVRQQLQFIVYAKAFAECKVGNQADFIMFLDIDEFWTPSDMQNQIAECLSDHNEADTVSFGWLNEHGGNHEFQPFSQRVAGQLSPLVKTAINMRTEVQEMSLHLPKTRGVENRLCNGEAFIGQPDNRECLHPELIKLRDTMIIHRMFRSELEYIAALSRGRPSDELPLKTNRRGYNKAAGMHVLMELKPAAYDDYRKSYEQFLNQIHLHEHLRKARENVMLKRTEVLNQVAHMPVDNLDLVVRLFDGCSTEVRHAVSTIIKSSLQVHQLGTRHQAMELALKIKNCDFELARFVMSKVALM
ncbi:glycosyltransferase family 92 protein [Bowmanella denitrificans]|uniref:glycosyltransferase family 92 protein n=1 Tax=Bowmanella denitrificans TaxID=366582 RepID=UPI000C9B8A2D|nr:glycosyltransferase family 2 protein [Bowmanella denitrificans]